MENSQLAALQAALAGMSHIKQPIALG